MAFGSTTFPLARCTGVCAATGRALAPGETCVGTLIETEGRPGLDRMDYSREAWERGERPQAPHRLFAAWKTSFSPKPEDKPSLLSDAELVDLFDELGEAADERRAAFRYLLAILLVRRRLLRQVGMRGRTMLLQPRGAAEGAEPIAVDEPALDDAAIGAALEQLSQIVPVDGAAGGADA